MLKTTLTYEFKDNEDTGRLYMIQNAENSFWALYDFDNELRDIVKHQEKADKLELDVDTVDHIRTILREIMHDKGIDLDQVS